MITSDDDDTPTHICDGCRGTFTKHYTQLVPDYVVVGGDEPVFCGHIRLCAACKRVREDVAKEATVAGFVALGVAAALMYVASAWAA